MTNLLILLSLPEAVRNQYRERLLNKFPQLNISVADHRSKVGPYIASADALLTFTPMMSDEVVREAVSLKWIQTLGSGVDNLVELPSLRREVIVTNVHGIHGAPVSEAALAAMFALGMRVMGISSGPRQLPGFDRMVPRDDLVFAVRDLDYFVLLTPLTPQTRGIIDAKVFAAMRPGAYLVNMARGGVVDEAALLE